MSKSSKYDYLSHFNAQTLLINSNIDKSTVAEVRDFLGSIFGFKPMREWSENVVYKKKGEKYEATIKQITIEINSYGGYVEDGFAVYDLLKSIPLGVKLTTVALGKTMSAAATIFCAGDQRLIHRNAGVLLHDLWGCNWGTYGEMQDNMEYKRKLMESVYRIISETTGKSIDQIKEDVHRKDLFLFGQEIIDYGLATGYV